MHANYDAAGIAPARLRSFQDIAVVEFTLADVVRHPLVEKIVRAYDTGPKRPER